MERRFEIKVSLCWHVANYSYTQTYFKLHSAGQAQPGLRTRLQRPPLGGLFLVGLFRVVFGVARLSASLEATRQFTGAELLSCVTLLSLFMAFPGWFFGVVAVGVCCEAPVTGQAIKESQTNLHHYSQDSLAPLHMTA